MNTFEEIPSVLEERLTKNDPEHLSNKFFIEQCKDLQEIILDFQRRYTSTPPRPDKPVAFALVLEWVNFYEFNNLDDAGAVVAYAEEYFDKQAKPDPVEDAAIEDYPAEREEEGALLAKKLNTFLRMHTSEYSLTEAHIVFALSLLLCNMAYFWPTGPDNFERIAKRARNYFDRHRGSDA